MRKIEIKKTVFSANLPPIPDKEVGEGQEQKEIANVIGAWLLMDMDRIIARRAVLRFLYKEHPVDGMSDYDVSRAIERIREFKPFGTENY